MEQEALGLSFHSICHGHDDHDDTIPLLTPLTLTPLPLLVPTHDHHQEPPQLSNDASTTE